MRQFLLPLLRRLDVSSFSRNPSLTNQPRQTRKPISKLLTRRLRHAAIPTISLPVQSAQLSLQLRRRRRITPGKLLQRLRGRLRPTTGCLIEHSIGDSRCRICLLDGLVDTSQRCFCRFSISSSESIVGNTVTQLVILTRESGMA